MTDGFPNTNASLSTTRLSDARTIPPRRDHGRSVAGAPHPPDDRARAARLSSIVKFAGHLATLGTEDAIILALLQAAAVWYDLDARAYYRDADGSFLLRTTLPGANRSDSPDRLTDCPSKPIHVTSLAELHQLGWQNPSAAVLLLPISVGGQLQWLVSVSGSSDDDAEAELGSLCAILGTLFDSLALKRAGVLRTRFLEGLAARSASPSETASALLTDLTSAVSAIQAGIWFMTDGDTIAPLASIGETPIQPPSPGHLEPVLDAHRILLPVPNGSTFLGALELRAAPDAPFTADHGALATAAASDLRVWMAGLRAAGSLDPAGPLNGSAFELRLCEEIERAKRFGLPIGLLVFSVHGPSAPREAAEMINTLVGELRHELRSCDVVASLEQGDLAVLFTHTDARGLSAALGRLSERLGTIPRCSEFPRFRIGQALYPSQAESASELLGQARLSARQPAASIM